MNEPLETISSDLGFSGNTLAEGNLQWILISLFDLILFTFLHLDIHLVVPIINV